MPVASHAFEGRCHCGAIGFIFHTSQPPARWAVRACQCSFCRGHGARTIADPEGSVTFQITEASKLRRYRFGTQSSDFLICGSCGVYVGALLTSINGQFATLNINTIQRRWTCQKRHQSHMKGSRVSKDSPGASSDGRQSLKPSNSRFVCDAKLPPI